MSISIRQAFRNVFSEKYNKVNCGLWLLLLIIYLFLNVVLKISASLPVKVLAFLLIILCLLLCFGITFLGTHNAIFYHKNGVIPNLFKDFIKILLSAKHFVCYLVSIFLYLVIPSFCYGFSFGILFKMSDSIPAKIILSVILVFLIIVNILLYLCIYFNAVLTLKCGAWFNPIKAYVLWRKLSVKNRLAIYLLKIIGFYILFCVAIIILVVIISIPFGIMSVFANGGITAAETNMITMAGGFFIAVIMVILSIVVNLIYIDLTAQLINKSYPNLGKKSKKLILKGTNNSESN